MKLVIIIPALNEEKTIGKIIADIPKDIPGITDIEVVVVDDGSTDRTGQIAQKSGAVVISHAKNRGVGRAFKTGIEYALSSQADIIVNIDGDGQFDPNDIRKLISPIMKKDYDFVTCTRFHKGFLKGRMPFIKRIGNRIISSLISFLIKEKFTDTQCGFRAYSRDSAMNLSVYSDYTYTQEVFIDLANKGFKMTEMPLKVQAQRSYGKSRVLNKGILNYIGNSMIIILRAYRDYKPLIFFGFPGVVFLGIGLLTGMGSFIYWLINGITTPVKTYVLISILFTILGVMIIILALIADMFIRIRRILDNILLQLKRRR